jgi:hypothetical protein
MFKTATADSCDDAICNIPVAVPGSNAAAFEVTKYAVLLEVVICADDVPPNRIRELTPPISIGFAIVLVDDVAKLILPVFPVNKLTLSVCNTLL